MSLELHKLPRITILRFLNLSQDFPKEERRRLAAKSRREYPTFGSVERQQVTAEVHQRMLEMEKEGSPSKPVRMGFLAAMLYC